MVMAVGKYIFCHFENNLFSVTLTKYLISNMYIEIHLYLFIVFSMYNSVLNLVPFLRGVKKKSPGT